MSKNYIAVLVAFLSGGCASLVHVQGISIDDVVRDADALSGREVVLKGCVQKSENWTHLVDCSGIDGVEKFIDLVGDDNFTAGAAASPVCVSGIFKGYDANFVGIGYLTSKIGLLEVSRIKGVDSC